MGMRSNHDSRPLAPARNTLRDLDSGLPVYVQTCTKEMDHPLFAARMATLLPGLLGVLLSITGVFEMAAYSVTKRLKEMGIRMALGAQRKEEFDARC
jgi:hypothetical protein